MTRHRLGEKTLWKTKHVTKLHTEPEGRKQETKHLKQGRGTQKIKKDDRSKGTARAAAKPRSKSERAERGMKKKRRAAGNDTRAEKTNEG